MRTSAISALAMAFFAGLSRPVTGQDESTPNCVAADKEGYEYMHSPRDGFVIYWTHPTAVISFHVEAEAQEWVSVGFSEDGLMVGSDAVVYLPADEDVSEHILGSQSIADILPSDTSELSSISIEQDSVHTIFSFTRNAVPEDTSHGKLIIPNIPDQHIYLIWAEGMDNTFGYHGSENRGSFSVDLFCPSAATPAPTANATDTPVLQPTAAVVETGAPIADTDAPVVEQTPPPIDSTEAPAEAEPTPAPTSGSREVTLTPAPASSSAPVGVLLPGTPATSDTPSPTVSVSDTPAPGTTDSGTPAPETVSDSGTPAPGTADSGTPAPETVSDSGTPAPETDSDTPAPTEAPFSGTDSTTDGETTGSPAATTTDEGTRSPVELVGGEKTPEPTSNSTGFVGAAGRVAGGGGGVHLAAVMSALMAICFGSFWAMEA